jgi:hypothetical protein
MLKNTSQRKKRESTVGLPLDPLLDEYQLAAILRRSVASLRRDRLLKTGCPYVKCGVLCRYKVSDVAEFIERNTHRGTHAAES